MAQKFSKGNQYKLKALSLLPPRADTTSSASPYTNPDIQKTIQLTQHHLTMDERETMRHLYVLNGIEIEDTNNQRVASRKLISVDEPAQMIEIAMIQLKKMVSTTKEHSKVGIINNNLGCAYILLGRYSDAQKYLNDAIKATNDATPDKDTLKNVAEHNLAIVKGLSHSQTE